MIPSIQARAMHGYRDFARATANVLDVPLPIVEYVILEWLYKQSPGDVEDYIKGTLLHRLLRALKGEYLIVPGPKNLSVYFVSGIYLSSRESRYTWHDLFKERYTSFSGRQVQRIENLLDRANIAGFLNG